jgi:hypothetical protein
MGRSHRVCLDNTKGNEVEHALSRLRDVINTSTQVERYIQILGYIDIDVRTEIPAVQYVLSAVTIIHFSTLGIPHTLLAQVREAYIVAGTLVTATNLQVGAILRCSFTIQLVCPRCIEVLVLADIIVSKRSTIAYILVVERDPKRLADLADIQCKTPKEEIAKALEGNWEEDLMFVLRQNYDTFKHYCTQLGECDAELEKLMENYRAEVAKVEDT